MRNFKLIILSLVPIFFLLSMIWGCGEKKEEAPAKPQVVSQKITIKKDSGPAPAVKAKPAPAKKTAATAPAAVPAKKTAKATVPAKTDLKAKEKTAEPEKPQPTAIAYSPEGKTDPFAPLFRQTPVAAGKKEDSGKKGTAPKKVQRKKRIPRTPLEKMDLSQLKLVGIIRSAGGNRALVQDASGKGYVLNHGTYIGIHEGFVKNITKDKVVVEEVEEDLYGKITLRERELILQKPVGDI